MAAKRIELNDKDIIQQYENGLPVSKIADINFVSKKTIYRILKRSDIEIGNTLIRLIGKSKLYELYVTKEMSISLIAKRHNVSYKTVRKALEKYSIPVRGCKSSEVQ